jgi:stress response protein YsnF
MDLQKKLSLQKPVTETKTVKVPLTHEEISVKRRPGSSDTTTTIAGRSIESEEL